MMQGDIILKSARVCALESICRMYIHTWVQLAHAVAGGQE